MRPRYTALLLFCTLLASRPGAHAQSPAPAGGAGAASSGSGGDGAGFGVSGRLVDAQDGTPVAYANVLLMHAADSTLARAEMSGDDGGFRVSAPDSGRYFVQAVMLGYDDWQSEAFGLYAGEAPDSAGGATRALGEVGLRAFAKTLETAVVTARKPFLEQQAGKMVVNVEGSVTGQTGSATQLLQKVPGVVVRQGNVSLAGSGRVTILIDGKPTRYMDVNALLKDLPAADIAKVEVITQPGAAYDAEGGSVLNIVLKRNVRLGTNGSVRLGAGRGTYDKLNASVRVSHRDGPLNAYGTVGYRRGSGFERLILDREVEGARLLQDNVDPFLPNTASVRGGIDYDLDERHAVGVSGRYSNTVDNTVGANTTRGVGGIGFGEELAAGTPLFSLATENVDDQDRVSYGADAFYRFEIDTAGRRLDVDASYAAFDREGQLRTTTRVLSGAFGSPIDDIRNQQRGASRVLAGEADYTHPVALGVRADSARTPRVLTLTAGAKYTRADVEADLRAQTRPMGTELAFENAPGLTNLFVYGEQIAAGYASAETELGAASVRAGLRFEHTFIDGVNVTSDSAFVRDYGGWFPSFGVSLPIKGSIGVSGAYSYRIDRPNYRSLNPFVRFLDPLTVQRGNTQLQPSYVHNAQASLTYDGQPFFRVAYSRTTDAIALLTEQDAATGVTEGYDANLDDFTRYGGHLFAPLSFIPRVDGYAGGMAYYTEYESRLFGGDFRQGSWSFTGFANATVELPLELKAELNYWIQSGGQEGILQSGTVYGSSVGLERKFLDGQLTVGVSYEDGLFDPWDGRIRYQAQRFDIVNTWETDIVMVNATWKFGNRYLKGKERRESAAREVLDRAGD